MVLCERQFKTIAHNPKNPLDEEKTQKLNSSK